MCKWYITALVILAMPLSGTPLHDAVNAHDYSWMVSLLWPMLPLKPPLDPNALDKDGDTALHKAVNLTIAPQELDAYIKALTGHKDINLYIINASDLIPWELALIRHRPLLIGKDPTTFRHPTTGETFVHLYCRHAKYKAEDESEEISVDQKEREQFVEILKTHGAEGINQDDNDGLTALHTAVYNSTDTARLMCVKELIAHGADRHATDLQGQTAEMIFTFHFPSEEVDQIMAATKKLLETSRSEKGRKGPFTPCFKCGDD